MTDFDHAETAGASDESRASRDHYHYADFARKVVGVGSVGTEAFMVLSMGDRDDEPLFLQVKEAGPSVLAPYAGAGEYVHRASGSFRASGWYRRPATRSWAGSPPPGCHGASSTCASGAI